MDRRQQQRVFVELPVKIWGMDANSRPYTQPASLRNISGRGATLQGVSAQLKPGDLIDLQYEGTKAQFRVVWLGKPGTEMHGSVGIENLSNDVQLWDVDPLRWLTAFPSFGFLLAVDPPDLAQVRARFEAASVACEAVGEITPPGLLEIFYEEHHTTYWDLKSHPLTGFGG